MFWIGAILMLITFAIQHRGILGTANTQKYIGLAVIIPMLMPYVVIATLLAVVNGFKVFDLIWVMTQGGPGRASETLAVTMYREGFILFNQGYAAAIAVMIGLAALVFSYFYLRSVLDQEKQI